MADCNWSVKAVDADTYKNIVDYRIISTYNKAAFNEINAEKVDKVWYLIVYKGESARFCVALGEIDGTLKCPFSAPFGYPESLKKNASLSDYYQAYDLVRDFFLGKSITAAEIYFPPAFYDNETIAAWFNVLLQNGFYIETCDVNYAFHNLEKMSEEYEKYIEHNAKKNLHRTQDYKYEFILCNDVTERHMAYDIIQRNRMERGYPLRMTEKKLNQTLLVVDAEWFLVRCDDEYIASALVYYVADSIAQVIYWGNLEEYAFKRPINYLAYELIKYYARKGVRVLDIGISTESGKPNWGLCDFKESIGCNRSLKYRFRKDLTK